jgi:hypothetical protein
LHDALELEWDISQQQKTLRKKHADTRSDGGSGEKTKTKRN